MRQIKLYVTRDKICNMLHLSSNIFCKSVLATSPASSIITAIYPPLPLHPYNQWVQSNTQTVTPHGPLISDKSAVHIRESNWQKSHFILSGYDAILVFSWSPNKFYHSLLGSQIKTVVKSCRQSERQRTKQKDQEPIVYEMNSARIKYKLLAWVGGL